VGSLLQRVDAAHGDNYRGEEKEIFLRWLLRYGEYRTMSGSEINNIK